MSKTDQKRAERFNFIQNMSNLIRNRIEQENAGKEKGMS
tara:strand:+ start:1868 stop:1984 length:117 start_codon:yes stop_codon:yes gene_type:complete